MKEAPSLRQVRPAEAAQLRDEGAVIVDVREQDEWEDAHIDGAIHIPLGAFAERWRELPPTGTLILQCHSGARSAQAAEYLLAQGRRDVANLAGGIAGWARAGLPLETGP